MTTLIPFYQTYIQMNGLADTHERRVDYFKGLAAGITIVKTISESNTPPEIKAKTLNQYGEDYNKLVKSNFNF